VSLIKELLGLRFRLTESFLSHLEHKNIKQKTAVSVLNRNLPESLRSSTEVQELTSAAPLPSERSHRRLPAVTLQFFHTPHMLLVVQLQQEGQKT
jgi:hypothetical protein